MREEDGRKRWCEFKLLLAWIGLHDIHLNSHDVLILAWDAPCFLLNINIAFECLQFIFWCFFIYWKWQSNRWAWMDLPHFLLSTQELFEYSFDHFYYYNKAKWSFLDLLKPKIFAAIMNIYSLEGNYFRLQSCSFHGHCYSWGISLEFNLSFRLVYSPAVGLNPFIRFVLVDFEVIHPSLCLLSFKIDIFYWDRIIHKLN